MTHFRVGAVMRLIATAERREPVGVCVSIDVGEGRTMEDFKKGDRVMETRTKRLGMVIYVYRQSPPGRTESQGVSHYDIKRDGERDIDPKRYHGIERAPR